jgi:hypothetical protein
MAVRFRQDLLKSPVHNYHQGHVFELVINGIFMIEILLKPRL